MFGLERMLSRAMSRRRIALIVAPVLVGAMSAIVPLAPAHAASGDFSLNLVAAAPYSYDHLHGGGAFDDATKGKHADVVESLEAVDFTCGDIVTYLTEVAVDDTAQAGTDGPQTIEVDYEFLMDTTGASGAAIGDITRVNVNYTPVVDKITGEDNVDQGNVDDGGSVATLVSETQTGPMFVAGSRLKGTVRVTDLERAEKVIVRVDVRLFCKPGTRPTGNLQGAVSGARLTIIKGSVPVSPAANISVGNQTVPFLQFGDLRFPALAMAKTVTTASGTCPGAESLDIHSGDTVKYCYVVTNPSTAATGAPLYDLTSVKDDNRTPSNSSDDFTVTLTGLTDLDGDGQQDDLGPGSQAYGEKLVTIATSALGSSTNTATVKGYTFSGDTTQPLTASDTASVNVTLVPAPAILLTKTVTDSNDAGTTASQGEVLTYTFTVKNTGNVPLSDIQVSDSKLWTGTKPCTDTSPLAAGATRVCLTFTYTVTAADLLNPNVVNTATGSGQPPSGSRVSDNDTASIPTNPEPGIFLTKSVTDASGNGQAAEGEVLTYTFTVTNTGNVPLSDIQISDSRLWSGTKPCTDTSPLAVGASRVCRTFAYTVTAADLLDPSLSNTATASGQPPNGSRVSDNDTATIPSDPAPAILLTKSVTDASGDGRAALGEVLTYTFTVTNTGNVPLSDVRVSDSRLWTGTKPCTDTSPLAIGGTRVCLAFAYTVTAADLLDPNLVNTATGSGQPPSGSRVSDDDSASIPSKADPKLDLVKAVADASGDGKGSLGEVLTYTFTVQNTGDVPLSDIQISDSRLWTGTKPCSDTGPLAAGGTRVCLTFAYTVTAADLLDENVVNTATGSGQPPHGSRVSDDDTASIPSKPDPKLDLVKAVTDASGDGKASFGEVLTYTFTVQNTGDVPLSNIQISDSRLWAGTRSCTNPGPLAVGETRLCLTVTYTVTAEDLLAADIENIATATGIPPHGPPVTDDGTATIPTASAAALDLDKSVTDAGGDGEASLNEVLTYTFTVQNVGNVPLSNIQISDSRLWTGTKPCTDPSPLAVGETRECLTFAYTVTAGDMLNPDLVNTATAKGTPAGGGADVTDTDDATIPTSDDTPQPAGLSIDKSVDVSQAAPGDVVTYTLKVTNTGPGAAENVVVTDVLPSGTTFVSASAPCTESVGTVTCALGTLGSGDTQTVTIKVEVDAVGGGDTSHQHQLDYTKVESHLSLFDDDTTAATAQCPSGYLATDGSVRLDHVDDGTGTFEDAVVRESRVTADGRGWTGTIRNDATGQVQAKVNVVCMSDTTVSGEDHRHPVLITGPVATTQTFTAGRHDVDLACGSGTWAVTPSFTFTAGDGVVSTRRLSAGVWRFSIDVDDTAAATFSIHCLATALGTAQGHSHDLTFHELTDTVQVPAGQVVEVRLTCNGDEKGIVAWADMDPGLISLGNDPQPVTRVFRFYNPTGSALSADYGLLCVGIRTNGGTTTGGDIKNTASVATSSSDATTADDQDSATFAVSTTGVVVAPRAAVVTRAGRTQVRLSVRSAGKHRVSITLRAAGKVGGTRLRAGSVLAQGTKSLRNGKAVVRLTARSAASKALRSGKVGKARLVIVSHGHKDVRVIRLR